MTTPLLLLLLLLVVWKLGSFLTVSKLGGTSLLALTASFDPIEPEDEEVEDDEDAEEREGCLFCRRFML